MFILIKIILFILKVGKNFGLTVNINSDKKSATLKFDWNRLNYITSLYEINVINKPSDVKVTGFTKNIKSAEIYDAGQDLTELTIFYLYEVSYTPVFKEILMIIIMILKQ